MVLVTAATSKPVDANLPQIWRTGTADDPKLLTALAPPGLVAKLDKHVGASYPQGTDESVEGDAGRVRFVKALLADKPQFTTVYMAGIDHAEHHGGPGSPEANAAIERTDALVGDLVAAARRAMPDITVVLVSDHGFVPISTDINLFKLLLDAGLIRLGADRKVASWEAMPWLAGGSAAVRLARPSDAALVSRVRRLLDATASDLAYHIARILDRTGVMQQGGGSDASFFIAMAPEFETGRDPPAPIAQPAIYTKTRQMRQSITGIEVSIRVVHQLSFKVLETAPF